jgi:glycopeptide antibiotics resistance protein
MAVRDTLFRVAPKRAEKAEPKRARSESEPEPPAKPKPKPPPKPRARTPRVLSLRPRTDKPRTDASGTGKPRTATKPRAAAKPRTDRTRTGRARSDRAATDKAATAAESRRPVLQRRSLGSTLARAVVMVVAIVGMVAFAVALAKVTLVPSPASVHLIHTNLKPGASIRAYLDQPELRDSVKQIGGNILLGVPFGVLLPMLFPRARGLVRVLLITAFVMVLVEATQGAIVEGRAFDIDDVILNTAGALIGYLALGRRLGRALHPRRTHWWHKLGYGRKPEV